MELETGNVTRVTLESEPAAEGGPAELDLAAARERALAAEARRLIEKAEGPGLTHQERKWLAEYDAGQGGADPAGGAIAEEEEAGPALQLEAGLVFPTLQDAAAAYGYSLRQVKNWRRDGRKAGKPCPLEHPQEVPAWFEAVYEPRTCPDRLRDAVERLLAGEPARDRGGGAEGAEVPAIVSHGGGWGPAEPELPEQGLEAMLRRAEREEAEISAQLAAAKRAGAPEVAALQTRAQKARDSLSTLSARCEAQLKARGDLLPRHAVKATLQELLGKIEGGLRQEMRRRRPRIMGAASLEDYNRETEEAVEQALEELTSSRFAEPLELELAG